MGNTIGNGSPPRVLLPDAPFEPADEGGARSVVIDRTAIPSNELATIIAGGKLLGRMDPPEHPLLHYGKIINRMRLGGAAVSTAVYLAGGIVGLVGMASGSLLMSVLGFAAFFGGMGSAMVAAVRDDCNFIAKNYYEMISGEFSHLEWKILLKEMTEDYNDAQLEAWLKAAGVTWKQLSKKIRPTREDGNSLTAKDIGVLFAKLKGEAVGDYVALAYATRRLGPLEFSTSNRTGPSEYFVALAQDITGRPQSDVTIENPTEISTLFCRMMGDIAYTTDAVSIPQFVLMGAHLMKYHTNALAGTEVADHMLGSIRAYLRGDLNAAYKAQVDALEKLERRDGTIEGVAVSALHHLSMAELIAERVRRMVKEGSKPFDTLITQASVHAETAIDGLSRVQGTGYVNQVPGMGMLMGRANTVLNAVRGLR
jgi:hypothetical protein